MAVLYAALPGQLEAHLGSDRAEFGVNNPEQVPAPASPYTRPMICSGLQMRLEKWDRSLAEKRTLRPAS